MKTARIFKSGNSQAVRLPREFQLDVKEVEILKKDGDLILRPMRKMWKDYFDRGRRFTKGFPDHIEDILPEERRLWWSNICWIRTFVSPWSSPGPKERGSDFRVFRQRKWGYPVLLPLNSGTGSYSLDSLKLLWTFCLELSYWSHRPIFSKKPRLPDYIF